MSANTTTLIPKQREAIYEAWIAALAKESSND